MRVLIVNVVYQAVIGRLEELERARIYCGNGHHFAQRLLPLIAKKLDGLGDDGITQLIREKRVADIHEAVIGHLQELVVQGSYRWDAGRLASELAQLVLSEMEQYSARGDQFDFEC